MADPAKLTSTERRLRAQVAAHESWARTEDPSARTAPGRRAFLDRFEREADPEGVLPPAERARRAEHLRKAHFARMAMKSAQARRAKRGGGEAA
jgi:hypothetical protein